MNQEKQREAYQGMLKKCPDILTPMKAARWSPVGKNTIYAALKNGEIESYTYKGGYIFTKDALIDYLVRTTNDKGKRYTIRGDKNVEQLTTSAVGRAGSVRSAYQQT